MPVAKYNVGVGDAFPADQGEPPRNPSDERDRHERRACGRHGHRNWPFRVAFILLAIWAVLSLLNHMAPHGLLVAAGILVAIGVANRLFGASREDRRAWRRARRHRRWEDR